jgi:hypothetical protein
MKNASMLKGQDIVLLLKLLANAEHLNWPQQKLATHLCLSVSAINASLMRLRQAKLLTFNMDKQRYQVILKESQELLVHGVKYFFPAKLGEYTIGMSTSYAAPLFSKQILVNQEEPSPVWPHIKGERRGLALAPLYHCVPDAVM